VNECGTIHFRDFVAGLSLLSNKTKDDAEGSIQFAFNIIDKNGNGSVQREELADMLRICFNGVSESLIDEVFNSIDANHDEKITYEEFLSYIRKDKSRSVLLAQVFKPLYDAVQGNSPKNEMLKAMKIDMTSSKHQVLVG